MNTRSPLPPRSLMVNALFDLAAVDTASLAALLQAKLWEEARADSSIETELRTPDHDLHILDTLLDMIQQRFSPKP